MDENLDMIRHSASHLMAQAVRDLYPGVRVAIGPSIETGFYYDFDYEPGFTEEDLPKIEKRMHELAAEDIPIERKVIKRQDAMAMFKEMGEPYKVELLEGSETTRSDYKGFLQDLCRGPHLPSTGKIKAFKLLSLAGAYWRGDERNKCYPSTARPSPTKRRSSGPIPLPSPPHPHD
jgi:threonyl-tRNA synthetase